MKDFSFYAPTQVVFGAKAEEKIPQLIKQYGGTKVLIHYGGKSAEVCCRRSSSASPMLAFLS